MGSRVERRTFARLTFERMLAVTVARVVPEIQRKKGQAVSPVLVDMDHLVAPQHIARLAREHDDVTERDRDIPAPREDAMREAAVAHVQEAAVAKARSREGQESDEVTDEVGVMRD